MLIEKIRIEPKTDQYPFNMKLFNQSLTFDLRSPVTLILGENGSGKSSFLKILQAKLKLIEIKIPNQHSKKQIDGSAVSLWPNIKKVKGFYFESLSFVNYLEYMINEIDQANQEIKRVDDTYKNKSEYSKIMAKSPYRKTIHELENMYSKDLSKSSHGEAYLDFFASRIKDNQLYLLDEPETPLSIQNQLTLMAMIMDACKRGCQFIIASHSPILTALPQACIYQIKNESFIKTDYEDIDSINLLRQFLNHKETFIKHLTDEEIYE
ncbi:ATP-binding cassette domain-containing protein [Hujiaoplasma nucleasis]|uniref:ATP-binding cassette domain-containing protein n=1 Tax=Hujiaoplasma nucleasis TaxID=2725268 RepID=A0A7L6N7W1_9MOLU|nr:ATP-binding cassette domain-containing protein [Hujiaoplasma nucleasis]QLY40634.1 ATP-binding cassette domain-containing protein [Hujiaoplasma nucleasis]